VAAQGAGEASTFARWPLTRLSKCAPTVVATLDSGRAEGFDVPAALTVDWITLRTHASAAAARAYAPYSRLHVGAAGLTDTGRVVSGCNVENASYGLTLCAECGLVSALHASGDSRLVAVSIVAGDGRPLAPCGRCRQLLFEAGGEGLLVDGGEEAVPILLSSLLPGAFGAPDIDARRETVADAGGRKGATT
jgi:cytidine deaminase